VTVPDARIAAARKYGERHGVASVSVEALVVKARQYRVRDLRAYSGRMAVVAAILHGEVTPVEEGAEDGR